MTLKKKKKISLILFWTFLFSCLIYASQCNAQYIEVSGGLIKESGYETQNIGGIGISMEENKIQGRIKYYRSSMGFTEISANYALYDDTVRLGLGGGMFFGGGMQPGITFLQDININQYTRFGVDIIAMKNIMLFQAGLKIRFK